MNKIEKEDVLKYLKSEVQGAKINTSGRKLNMEMLKFYNSYSLLDRIFPFHYFLNTGDKIPDLNINYLCTFRYLSLLRYQFVNLLSIKYHKYMTPTDIQVLKQAEQKYTILNTIFYSSALALLYFRPLKSARLLNFYLAAYLISCSRYYSVFLIKDDILPLKQKVTVYKPLKIPEQDVYDYTIIPDWRAYFYFYKIL